MITIGPRDDAAAIGFDEPPRASIAIPVGAALMSDSQAARLELDGVGARPVLVPLACRAKASSTSLGCAAANEVLPSAGPLPDSFQIGGAIQRRAAALRLPDRFTKAFEHLVHCLVAVAEA